jgi:hypothetical protein
VVIVDQNGRIIAEMEDYAAVRELIADLVAVGVDVTIRPEVREVVKAVAELKSVLQLDKSAISRRVADALDGGFLKNLEDRKGRPARLVLGDALPANREILPFPEQLVHDAALRGCTVDRGDRPPPPHSGADQEDISFEARPPGSSTNSPWEQRL